MVKCLDDGVWMTGCLSVVHYQLSSLFFLDAHIDFNFLSGDERPGAATGL